MNPIVRSLSAVAFSLAPSLAISLLLACHLSKDESGDEVFSFPSLPEEIAGADHATLLLLDTGGTLIDTLYSGPVTAGTRFLRLPADGYDGGAALISIVATRAGEVHYQEERRYGGRGGGPVSRRPIRVPRSSVSIDWGDPRLEAGETRSLPAIVVAPADLSEKSVTWSSLEDSILRVDGARMEGRKPGMARLVAVLDSDTAKRDTVHVEVRARAGDATLTPRDTVPPAAVAFTSATSPAVVNASHGGPVQWAWTRTGGPSDSFLVSLNGARAVRQDGTTYALDNPGNQTYTLSVQQVDAAGNASPAVSHTVLVDRAAPPAPAVTGVTPTAAPTWTWSAGPGSDGTRVYRFRLAPAAEYSPEGPGTSFSPEGLASGTHTVFVQERDAAGNWSTEGSHTLLVDRTGPRLTISSPTEMGRVANHNPQVAGIAEDDNGVRRVEYRLNSSDYLAATRSGESWSFTASYNIGVNVVWVRGEDNFGNRDSVRVNIYKYPNVLFVRQGATGNGRSWEDAYGELYSLLDTSRSFPAGTEIWVAKGNYFPDPDPRNEASRLYITSSNFSLRGGFYNDRVSVDTSVRDFSAGATVLNSVLQIGREYAENDLDFVTIEGFTMGADRNGRFGLRTRNPCNRLTIRNVRANGLMNEDDVISIRGHDNLLENCEFAGNNVSQATLLNLDGFTTIKNCRVVDNRSSGGGIVGGIAVVVDGGYYENNFIDAGEMFHFGVSQMTRFLIIKNAAVQGGVGSILGAGEFPDKIEYGPNNRDF